jgi:hypothetical protein
MIAKNKKIISWSFLLLTVVLILFYSRVKLKNIWLDLNKETLPQAIEYQAQVNQQSETDKITTSSLPVKSLTDKIIPATDSLAVGYANLPETYNLKVPFTPQAPLADWNETFKEACEEASSLIVHFFYQNKTFTPPVATDEILKMVDWQITNFGGHFDLTASQTAKMIKDYLDYKRIEIIDNPTINEIKYHVSQGRPVIIPAAGRLLGNPYFRQPGPIYHMLVIKGYTEKKFIANDPGTKRGADFLYDYQTVMETMHDWDPQDIMQGGKKIIVVYPNN